ncbi:MAG: hypothetical protein ACT4NY_16680 [Pseudonocardiales bacterium]
MTRDVVGSEDREQGTFDAATSPFERRHVQVLAEARALGIRPRG